MKNFFAAAGLLVGFIFSSSVFAAGALVIGEPKNLADGFASGWAINQSSEDVAQARAFEQCRHKADATEAVRSLCRTLRTFANQCVTIALDLEPGATGTGYAIAPTKVEAERIALENCRATAGSRGHACRVINGGCDGTAK